MPIFCLTLNNLDKLSMQVGSMDTKSMISCPTSWLLLRRVRLGRLRGLAATNCNVILTKEIWKVEQGCFSVLQRDPNLAIQIDNY